MKVNIFPIYKKYISLEKNSREEIEKIIKNEVNKTLYGYAGFRKISYLIDYVWQKDASAGSLKAIAKTLDGLKVERSILLLLKQCERILPTPKLNIFYFPLARTRKNMKIVDGLHGVMAYTPWQKNFLLFIHPQIGWKKYFDMAVIHEYNHSVRMQYFPPNEERTMLDYIVLEGLADNFVMIVTGFVPAWARPFPKKTEEKILGKIKGKISSIDYYSFHEKLGIMLGNKEFPPWTGYRIGFSIVNKFLHENPKIDFKKLVMMNSKNFLSDRKFASV